MNKKIDTIKSSKSQSRILFAYTIGGDRLNFSTSYHQFYISDKDSPMATDSENFWTDEAHQNKFATENRIVGIGTSCYGPVKCEINIVNKEPEIKFINEADHIVEGDLLIKSGTLEISDCPDGTIVFSKNIDPNNYRVRVYSFDLATVVGDEGDDYYLIEVFPSKKKGVHVIKN